MPFVGTRVPYHQQDIDDYCGVAAVQMVLAGLGLETFKQYDLYTTRSNAPVSSSGTSPSKVAFLLNQKCQPTANDQYREAFDTDAADGCNRIAAALLTRQGGVPAIVHGDSHWIVVTGVEIDGDPDQGPPYAIKGFYVNDPMPRTAKYNYPDENIAAPPPDHAWHDKCGSGNLFGSPDTYVTLYEWKHSHWKDQSTVFGKPGYITVSNGPPSGPVSWTAMLRSAGRSWRSLAARMWLIVTTSNDPKEAAKQVAREGIRSHRIDQERRPLAEKIAGYKFGDVVCVDVLATPPRHSYQIAMMRSCDHVGTACVDADSGEFLGVQAPPALLSAPSFRQEFAIEALTRHAAEFTDIMEPTALEKASFTINPALVWRPCRESMSPYYPFIQGDLAGAILYVGLDGRVHRRLTPHGPE